MGRMARNVRRCTFWGSEMDGGSFRSSKAPIKIPGTSSTSLLTPPLSLCPIYTISLAMSASTAPRMALRQSRFFIQRRTASTTTEASNAASSGAAKAKESASQTAGKAQEGLSKVTSSAGSSLSKAGSAAADTIGSLGGRTGRVISFAQGN